MFCPKCKSEYREGYKRCAACDIGLVAALPPDPEPEYTDVVIIFEGDAQSAAIVLTKLQSRGIEAWLNHENEISVIPSIEPSAVLVHVADEEAARQALAPDPE